MNRDDFERRLDLPSLFDDHAFFRNDVSHDLYFVGRKHGAPRRLSLDLKKLRAELDYVNTRVTADVQPRFRGRLSAFKGLPLTWARHLPDPAYQAFLIRWASTEKAIRRALKGK